MKLLYISCIWLCVIHVYTLIHYYVISYQKREPNHGLSFALAFILAVVISYAMYDTLTFFIVSIIYLGLMFWVVFNLELNFFRHKPLLHLGERSWFDRMETRMKSPGMTLGMKIILMIMCSFVLLDIHNQWG